MGVTSELSTSVGDSDGTFYTTLHSTERIRRVSKGFKKVQEVPIENYNFETFCHEIAIHGQGRYHGSKTTVIHALIIYLLCCIQIASTGYFALAEPVWYRIVLWVAGSFLYFRGTLQMQCLPSANMLVASKKYMCGINILVLCGVRIEYILGLTMFMMSAHGLTFYLSVAIQGIFLFVLISVGHYCIYLRLKAFMTTKTKPQRKD